MNDLGKQLFCSNCKSQFWQQGIVVHKDNDGNEYVDCPYCNDKKIKL